MKYQLTPHAIERAAERAPRLSVKEIEALIDDFSVLAPSPPGDLIENRLFWSQTEDQPFVAVTNRLTGEVITLLLGWRPELGSAFLYTRRGGELVWGEWVCRHHVREAITKLGLEIPEAFRPSPPREKAPSSEATHEFVARMLLDDGLSRIKRVLAIKGAVFSDEDRVAAFAAATDLAIQKKAVGLTLMFRRAGDSASLLHEWELIVPVNSGWSSDAFA